MASEADANPTATPGEVHSFDALLIDLDGTLVDSTEAIVKHWHKIGKELGVDPEVVLQTSHGRRSIDTLRVYDPSLANWEYVCRVEGQIPKEFGSDAKTILGARELLNALEQTGARWAIVTSGTRPLATGWLDVLKLPHPQGLVVAEDVERGKPQPDCYQLGKTRLGLSSDVSVLVLEDSAAGIRSGKAAGCKVVALSTTHRVQQLQEAGADWIVQDLRDVTFSAYDEQTGAVQLEIRAIATRD